MATSTIDRTIVNDIFTGSTNANGAVALGLKPGYVLLSVHCVVPDVGYCAIPAFDNADGTWLAYIVGFVNAVPNLPYANQNVRLHCIWAKSNN